MFYLHYFYWIPFSVDLKQFVAISLWTYCCCFRGGEVVHHPEEAFAIFLCQKTSGPVLDLPRTETGPILEFPTATLYTTFAATRKQKSRQHDQMAVALLPFVHRGVGFRVIAKSSYQLQHSQSPSFD